jgi:chromosome segregation ATPase
MSAAARTEQERLVGVIVAIRARLAEVEADLREVQTRRRDAEKELRSSTRRLKALERSFPIRIARALKRLRRR